MNNITVFNFNQNQVRTQTLDGEPWFCLADVCAALELKNSRMATSVKDVKSFYTLTAKGQQNINFINEPNLYRLIFRSNKPQAQAFADWVYSEVLPSIRKTGGYGSLDVSSLAKAVAAELKTLPALPAPKAQKPTYPEWFYKFAEEQFIRSDEITPFSDIYQLFDLFCCAENKPTPSANKLGRFLEFMGFEKSATRKGAKAYILSLKQYEQSSYRYRYKPCDYYDGAGVYRCKNGETYRVIREIDKPVLRYCYFNPRTNQAEGCWFSGDQTSFESTITGKLVGIYQEV